MRIINRLNVFYSKITSTRFFFSVIPMVLIIFLVISYSVDVPVLDQWNLVSLFNNFYNGHLTIHDLWTQHNEHRILFPRLIMILLAWISGWNIYYELVFNILIAIGMFITTIHQLKETFSQNKINLNNLLFLFISMLIFSTTQWENWSWGFQIQIYLNVFAVMLGFVLLGSHKFTWFKLSMSLLSGLVATYSFANGSLFWIIGLGIIPFIHISKKNKIILYGVWLLFSLLTLSSYYYHYQKPAGHPPLTYLFDHPIVFAKYIFAYIGAPISGFNNPLSIGIGGIGLALFLILLVIIITRKSIKIITISPWLSIALYSLLSSIISSIGRAGFGYEQALSSRYMAEYIGVRYALLTNSGSRRTY